MKKVTASKSNSFRAPLLEIVIVIGIFAIVSVYLLRMFMVADRLQGKAVATTKALVRAESVVEFIKGYESDSTSDKLFEALVSSKGATKADGKLMIYYDKSWNEVEAAKAYYKLVLTCDTVKEEQFEKLQGTVVVSKTDDSDTFCELEFSKIFGEK